PNEIKLERLNRLLKRQLEISEKRFASRIGKTMEVLVEGEAKKQTKVTKGDGVGRVWTSRTSCNRIVNFIEDSNRNLTGRLMQVKITASTPLSLTGEIIKDASLAESERNLPVYDSLFSSEIVG
ncbi:MAG: TRAM domain-containing protein, partial [Proteobacteria bacterium]